MTALVVDTNVPIVANGRSSQAGPSCVLACIDALDDLRLHGTIVIDNLGHIVDEYRRHLSPSGQPGVGDIFFKWLWQNQGNAARCEMVEIHRRDDGQEYEGFPDDPKLARFDPSDRKFVAAARASRFNPRVLNATDTDWWQYRECLEKHGVRVEFLCPDLMCER